MIQFIYHAYTVLLLLINVAGLSLLLRRWLPTFALARAAGILLLCAVLFFIEHFYGLGKLQGLWPITTGGALYMLYRTYYTQGLTDYWRAERIFLLAFLYGLAWKWTFPVIYASSERITDLYFISNYLPGTTLPPLDNWYPPQRFDFYYAWQHYAAALLGRILNLSPGLTYNLAFALLMALPITLAWEFTGVFLTHRWQRALIVLTFMIGGTGATPFVHLGYTPITHPTEQQQTEIVSDAMWASQRFIGSFDQRLNTELGKRLVPKNSTPGWEARDLPMEDFGYQFYVGDYHPPLGGFLLLMLALTCIAYLETARPPLTHNSLSPSVHVQALLVFTVPLMMATNTWAFPLQALLVLAWIAWRSLQQRPPNWLAILFGGGLGFVLLYPFLSHFTSQAVPTPIKLVPMADHTPLLSFMLLHWPLLLFVLLAFIAKGAQRLIFLFVLVFLGLLTLSEVIFVDDPTGGRYERTNTVMKWWGWIWSGGLVALTTLLLTSRIRWLKGLVVAALLLVNGYAYDVMRYWIHTGKDAAGELAAHTVYTRDPVVRAMFHYLATAPKGIVLENNYGGSFTDSGVYAAFAVKPTLLGWPMHLLTWHKSIEQAWVLKDQIVAFYQGKLPEAAQWLLANNVDYIVWNARDAQVNTWQTIQTSIASDYTWQEFQSDPTRHIGFWIKRKALYGFRGLLLK